MNSIDEPNAPMGEEMRAEFVGHLKSEDYFDVAKHPKAVVRLENCTAKSLKGVVIVKGVEMPFDVPATISIGETESKITGEFNLNFAPFKMEGIGSKADPEYVSPEVKFNLVLKFKK
jgi:polyisoprenoid-binding protein YceI